MEMLDGAETGRQIRGISTSSTHTFFGWHAGMQLMRGRDFVLDRESRKASLIYLVKRIDRCNNYCTSMESRCMAKNKCNTMLLQWWKRVEICYEDNRQLTTPRSGLVFTC